MNINECIDYEKAKKEFENYLDKYDRNNGSINLKIIHSYEVVNKSEYIARNLNLDEEDIILAKIIALLHDIGRFEQIKEFGAFDDKKLEHAKYSVKLLFEDSKYIRSFVTTSKYDELIYKAIYNHNKLEIESGLNEHELLHARIIRDADKLDNFRVKEADKLEDMFPNIYDKNTIDYETITPDVYETFLNNQCIKLSTRKTIIDYWLCVIAFIFDLNFNVSLKYVKDNDYVNKLIDRLEYKNYETKKQIEKIKKSANEYINKKVKRTRIATRCYLFKDNKIVAIKYKNKGDRTGYYDLPGGKIEDGESAIQCAKRECYEETGLSIDELNYSGNLIIEYPDRIFDFSVFITNNFDGDFKKSEENDVELIDIERLINSEKKFGCIKLLEKDFINNLMNCTNFKYKIEVDDNENIVSINEIE